MEALVAYESMFGNTHDIARAIARGFGGSTRVIPIGQLTLESLEGVDLLVVGGPTHAHGMSRPQTRSAAHDQGAGGNIEFGVRERVPAPGRRGVFAAAFDTRINKPALLTGAAAKGIGRLLTRRGFRLIVRPESFLVESTSGPLAADELERAMAWGQSLRAELEANRSAA